MSYRIASQLAWQVVDGQAVLVDPASGTAVGLNYVGTFIWSLMGNHSEDAIAEAVASHFDVDVSTARADVVAFMKDLSERGLLTKSE